MRGAAFPWETYLAEIRPDVSGLGSFERAVTRIVSREPQEARGHV